MQFVGLSEDDTIILPRFRQLIVENFVVDTSFMYRRLFNALDSEKIGTVNTTHKPTLSFTCITLNFLKVS